jgi:nucleotide-binding universal stress UspA family protein
MMYKRVLVALDGSPWSDAALGYAIALTTHTGAQLRILTVPTAPVAYAVPDVMGTSDLVMETVERQGQEILTLASAEAESAGVAYEIVCKWGNVPETILQTAVEEECDLIVLGSRLLTGWKRLVIGSVSNAVTAKAQQPVLVVKQSSPPLSHSCRWRRVLVATGGSPWSDAAVDHALALAQVQHLGVYILYVESQAQRAAPESVTATSEGKNVLALAEARAVAAGVPYKTRLAHGNAAEAILACAAEHECDVIILGSRGLSGWKRVMLGSVSNAVAAKATLPVLIVKRFLAG